MKNKLFAILMVAVLSMSLMACGGKDTPAAVETTAETTAETTVETTVETQEEVVADVEEEISGEEAMRMLFTTALAGSDEAENTYWFLFDDELTVGAFVILSADYTQSVNVVGNIVSEENGALTIVDEEAGEYISFSVVEEGEDYLIVSIEEGNEVTLINYDFEEALQTVLAIDEVTEIIN